MPQWTWYIMIHHRKWYIKVYKSELEELLILIVIYPLVNCPITMENHLFLWENPLFLWPFSIANCWHNQRVVITAHLRGTPGDGDIGDGRRRSEPACCPTRSHHPKAAFGESGRVIVQSLYVFVDIIVLLLLLYYWYLIVISSYF